MCNLKYGYFAKSDGTDIPNCTVMPTESVQIRCVASFSGAEVGQQYYARLMAWMPSGSPYVHFTPNVAVSANHIFSSPNLPISDATGIWETYGFEIYDASGAWQCSGYGKGSGSCETLNVTSVSPIDSCTMRYAYFIRAGGTSIPNCNSISPTENIEAHCIVSFTGGYIGQKFQVDILIKDPSGTTRDLVSTPITVTANHIFSIPLRNYSGFVNPDGTLKLGTYLITNVLVLDSGGYTRCQGAGKGSGECESITIQTTQVCSEPSISSSIV